MARSFSNLTGINIKTCPPPPPPLLFFPNVFVVAVFLLFVLFWRVGVVVVFWVLKISQILQTVFLQVSLFWVMCSSKFICALIFYLFTSEKSKYE